jgi:ABC-2 type transport system permease protein/sodium transport system permease protein
MANPVDESTPDARLPAWTRVLRLARKELREILRDRRTIITLIAMPVLLYPLMSVVFKQFNLAAAVTGEGGPAYHIAVVTDAEGIAFLQRLDVGKRALRRARAAMTEVKPPEDPSKLGTPKKRVPPPQVKLFREQDEPRNAEEREAILEGLKEKLRENKYDLIVVIPGIVPENNLAKGGPKEDRALRCQIISMSNSATAQQALTYVETVFAAANEANLKQRLGVPVEPHVLVLSVQRETVQAEGGSGIVSLAALVPLILILMTITGAVYPAIDLTAGERERGTLEILVAAPVARFELLCAKYITVVTVAILTAVVNLVCMTVTIVGTGLGPALFPEGLSFLLLGQIFALLLLFACFFSAILLCLTSFARSFKEAQAYLIPLMLASLAPGVMAMMPGLKLEGVMRVLPLVNIILMARDLFESGVELFTGFIVVLTTILYALAALSLAARVFGSESVLYSEQSGWSDLFRRPDHPQPAATIPMALWCLALMVPLQFSMVAILQAIGEIPPLTIMLIGMPINLLLFGCLPAVFVLLGRVQFTSGFGLQSQDLRTAFVGLTSGLILGLSLWPLELAVLSATGLSAQMENRYGEILQSFRAARESLGWGVLALVIIPAVLEEFFFRGMLYGALERRFHPLVTIAVCGLLFGLTHVVLGGAIGMERLIPSAILGLILSAVRWRSGSIWPCLLLHVCHNSILLIVGIKSPGTMDSIPWYVLAGGAAGTGFATALLWFRGSAARP